MDKDLEMLDERYVKRIEYIEMITSIKKDITSIKWILGIIAVGSITPVIEGIMKLVLKGWYYEKEII